MREGARQSEVTRHSERTSQSEGVQTVEGMSAEQHTIGQLRDILKDSGRDSGTIVYVYSSTILYCNCLAILHVNSVP